MDAAVWGTVGQWVAATVTLTVLLYAIWKDNWTRPKLVLSFDPDGDIKSQDNSRLWEGMPASQFSRWLRIRVRNANRWKVAKQCKAYLTGIKRLPTGEDLFPSDVRQLRWMHDHAEKPAGRDLLPGVDHWFDVVASFDNQTRLILSCFPDWGIDAKGEYLLTVQVSAEDTDPVTLKVVVGWEGGCSSLRGRISTI